MASNGNDPSSSTSPSKDPDISHLEKPDQDEIIDNVSPEKHAKIFRKVDWHLMPMLMALYLISNLDR